MITSTIVADRLATSSVYRPARAGPVPVVVECPDDLCRLFEKWRTATEDERFGAKYDLTIALYQWRYRWILCGDWAFYIRRNDEIVVEPRWMEYPPKKRKKKTTS